SRRRACCWHHKHGQRYNREPIGPSQDRSRLHRLRQGQSPQSQHGVGRHRSPVAYRGRTLQNDDRHRHAACALSRRRALAYRPDGRTGAGVFWPHYRIHRAHQGWQAARARRNPTVAEFLPGYEASTWYGVGAPMGTPAEIVDKLNREFTAGLADPKIKQRLTDLGGVPMPMTPADFGKFIAKETEKWANVIKFAGIKPEGTAPTFRYVRSANRTIWSP